MNLSEYILLPLEQRRSHIDLSTPCELRYRGFWCRNPSWDFFGVVNDVGPLKGKIARAHCCSNDTTHSHVCVNPLHHYIGTMEENSWDRSLEKRQAGGHAMRGKKRKPMSEEHRKNLSIAARKRHEKHRKEGYPMFQCDVTGYVSTGTGLTHYQRFRGIDTKQRTQIK